MEDKKFVAAMRDLAWILATEFLGGKNPRDSFAVFLTRLLKALPNQGRLFLQEKLKKEGINITFGHSFPEDIFIDPRCFIERERTEQDE